MLPYWTLFLVRILCVWGSSCTSVWMIIVTSLRFTSSCGATLPRSFGLAFSVSSILSSSFITPTITSQQRPRPILCIRYGWNPRRSRPAPGNHPYKYYWHQLQANCSPARSPWFSDSTCTWQSVSDNQEAKTLISSSFIVVFVIIFTTHHFPFFTPYHSIFIWTQTFPPLSHHTLPITFPSYNCFNMADLDFLISCLAHTDQSINFSDVAIENGIADGMAVKAPQATSVSFLTFSSHSD